MSVSVVIPAYNAEQYLGAAIDSALKSSQPPDEIIVVDDGSTDRTAEVAAGFGGVVSVIEGSHAGAAAARNRGAARAGGSALMFLDADDLLGREALSSLTGAIRRSRAGVALGPWYRLEYVDEKWVRRPASCPPRVPGHDPLQGWLMGWYHPPCAILWSRQAFEKTGGWDETLTVNDDGELIMRALALGIPFTTTSSGASYYRRARKNEETLSGAGRTEEGLHSRMRSLDKVAGLLMEAGTLKRYKRQLAFAYDDIALASADRFPALSRRAWEMAEEYGGPKWKRNLRRSWSLRLARLGRLIRTSAGKDLDGPVAAGADDLEGR